MFAKIIQSILLLTTPTLIAQPTSELPRLVVHQDFETPIRIPDLHTLSYDEVVDLLTLIESDSFEDRCSADELDQINEFLSFLAMEGANNNEKIDVANATACLLSDGAFGYTITPAIYMEGPQDIVLCKSWVKKKCGKTKDFVKKHKKAIIIGAIVIVTVAVVVVAAIAISSSAATAAAAGGLASVGGSKGESDSKDENDYQPDESLTSALESQVSSFKETVAQEQFAAASESNGISIEDNGRIVGSLFAHKTIDTLTESAKQNPCIANELKDLGVYSQYPTIAPHQSTDFAFSTDYTNSYVGNFADLNGISYQIRGDLALSSECYHQAVQDFGKAISLNPNNPMLYLERGIANFELGNYENSIADYAQYIDKKGEISSVTDFSLGFAKGVPKGVYESGKGTLLFLSDFIVHPVDTSKQVFDSLSQLAILVKNDEFDVVGQSLSPELHQLVTQWDNLPDETRGELAGYAVGKIGTDLMAPGVVAKVASKSINSAKELAVICKNIQIAQEALILETAAGIKIPGKIAEIVEVGKKTAVLGEELGFTTQEIGKLQQVGKLESAVAGACEHLSPPMMESFEIFDRAQKFLKPYKGFMPESQARELIHQAGVRTFPRPQGIPDNFRVKISKKGAGMIYMHPAHTETSVRIMPGKPHSPFPHQQKPYINQMKNGKALDNLGNVVKADSPEAHIPYEKFVYRD